VVSFSLLHACYLGHHAAFPELDRQFLGAMTHALCFETENGGLLYDARRREAGNRRRMAAPQHLLTWNETIVEENQHCERASRRSLSVLLGLVHTTDAKLSEACFYMNASRRFEWRERHWHCSEPGEVTDDPCIEAAHSHPMSTLPKPQSARRISLCSTTDSQATKNVRLRSSLGLADRTLTSFKRRAHSMSPNGCSICWSADSVSHLHHSIASVVGREGKRQEGLSPFADFRDSTPPII
jgi:hypothetical protein